MLRVDLAGSLYPLCGVGGRHPYVGQHRVGPVLLHRGHEPVQVGHGGDQVEFVDVGKEGGGAFPHQVVVLGEHHAERHSPDRTHPVPPPERTGPA